MRRQHVTLTAIALVTISTLLVSQWKIPSNAPLLTRWAKQVSPSNSLPEYPRPQMVRGQWLSLNGLWQYSESCEGKEPPVGKYLDGRILVPFPIESALSGVMKPADRLWYRRTFVIPSKWSGKRVILHFGAVDWEATVFVNGKRVGQHRGGYDPFDFDITDALMKEGEQELLVGVFDPTDGGGSRTVSNYTNRKEFFIPRQPGYGRRCGSSQRRVSIFRTLQLRQTLIRLFCA